MFFFYRRLEILNLSKRLILHKCLHFWLYKDANFDLRIAKWVNCIYFSSRHCCIGTGSWGPATSTNNAFQNSPVLSRRKRRKAFSFSFCSDLSGHAFNAFFIRRRIIMMFDAFSSNVQTKTPENTNKMTGCISRIFSAPLSEASVSTFPH